MWHFTLYFSYMVKINWPKSGLALKHFVYDYKILEKFYCRLLSVSIYIWLRIILHCAIYESPGFLPQLTNHQELSTISTSAPVLSMSSDRSESSATKNDDQVLHEEGSRPSKKAYYLRGSKPLSWRWSYAIKIFLL